MRFRRRFVARAAVAEIVAIQDAGLFEQAHGAINGGDRNARVDQRGALIHLFDVGMVFGFRQDARDDATLFGDAQALLVAQGFEVDLARHEHRVEQCACCEKRNRLATVIGCDDRSSPVALHRPPIRMRVERLAAAPAIIAAPLAHLGKALLGIQRHRGIVRPHLQMQVRDAGHLRLGDHRAQQGGADAPPTKGRIDREQQQFRLVHHAAHHREPGGPIVDQRQRQPYARHREHAQALIAGPRLAIAWVEGGGHQRVDRRDVARVADRTRGQRLQHLGQQQRVARIGQSGLAGEVGGDLLQPAHAVADRIAVAQSGDRRFRLQRGERIERYRSRRKALHEHLAVPALQHRGDLALSPAGEGGSGEERQTGIAGNGAAPAERQRPGCGDADAQAGEAAGADID
ncbi:hypothetical protein WR25_20545 [Diploscapter pachys]|uniref:Uncharacterized protein n=1 Tax=Diploscapter pachys TaxID=2018661 RepID=A0A2A2K7K8_9BILA|nr:hypothetical protein WR25_20545 [Diploscapter pachys]